MLTHGVCFRIGALTVHWYGVLMALGFLAGLANWGVLGRRERRDFAFCSDLLFWIMVAGILGARLAYVAASLEQFRGDPLSMLFIHQGGLIYYGGFLGAGLALLILARVRGERPAALFDFVITSVPLAHAFGRVGCFLNGCCYGAAHRGLLAVTYPAGSAPWCDQVEAGLITRKALRTAPVHAVQLYEAAFNVLLYLLLVRFYRRRRRDGTVLAAYLLIYPLGRFLLERVRGDERVPWGGLSAAQWLSAGLWLFGYWLWWRSRRPPAARTPAAAS